MFKVIFETKKENQVQLQGIGWKNAIPANAVQVGQHILWNWGFISEILEIVPTKSGKSLNITTKSETGYVNTSRYSATRLLAINELNPEVQ